MIKQCLLENDLASDIDDVAFTISEEAFTVDKAALSIDYLPMLILQQERMTTGVHLNVTENTIDVKTSEWEDFWEFTIVLQLGFQEEHFAFSRANMAITGHDVTLLVDHEASLVDIDFVAMFVFTKQKLYIAGAVSVENSHDLLQFKCLAIIVE